jgi:hypothetical protein
LRVYGRTAYSRLNVMKLTGTLAIICVVYKIQFLPRREQSVTIIKQLYENYLLMIFMFSLPQKNYNPFLVQYLPVKVKVSHNRPRWPKGFRLG